MTERRACARCGQPTTFGYICNACYCEMPAIYHREDLIGVSRARIEWVKMGIPGSEQRKRYEKGCR